MVVEAVEVIRVQEPMLVVQTLVVVAADLVDVVLVVVVVQV